MRHSRTAVFGGAFLALALMSVLSSALGHVLPKLLPKRYTTIAAALLFWIFGAHMLKEALAMEGGKDKIQEEIREVEREVEEAEQEAGESPPRVGEGGISLEDLETGKGHSPSPPASPGRGRRRGSSVSREAARNTFKEGAKNLCSFFFSPIFVQTFVLTFLAEWGDRSQISTIALAAAHVGSLVSHLVCFSTDMFAECVHDYVGYHLRA
jgi:putative Ca2+/H+ antiporter (TMEM165/GDT1 family)